MLVDRFGHNLPYCCQNALQALLWTFNENKLLDCISSSLFGFKYVIVAAKWGLGAVIDCFKNNLPQGA